MTHYPAFLLCNLYFSLVFQYDCLKARNSCEGREGTGILILLLISCKAHCDYSGKELFPW